MSLPFAQVGPAARRVHPYPCLRLNQLPGWPPWGGASWSLPPVMPSAAQFKRRDWGTLGRAVGCEPRGHADGGRSGRSPAECAADLPRLRLTPTATKADKTTAVLWTGAEHKPGLHEPCEAASGPGPGALGHRVPATRVSCLGAHPPPTSGGPCRQRYLAFLPVRGDAVPPQPEILLLHGDEAAMLPECQLLHHGGVDVGCVGPQAFLGRGDPITPAPVEAPGGLAPRIQDYNPRVTQGPWALPLPAGTCPGLFLCSPCATLVEAHGGLLVPDTAVQAGPETATWLSCL